MSQSFDNEEHPVAYASRSLNSHEKNYGTIDKEMLAIIFAIKSFRPYLYGKQFCIQTDHQPLSHLAQFRDTHGRQARWLMLLQEFDFRIDYRQGRRNNADCLSRLFPSASHTVSVVTETTKFDDNVLLESELFKDIVRAQRKDSDIRALVNFKTDGSFEINMPSDLRQMSIIKCFHAYVFLDESARLLYRRPEAPSSDGGGEVFDTYQFLTLDFF